MLSFGQKRQSLYPNKHTYLEVKILDFLRLIWASLLGYFLFGQVPEALVWVGGAVIFLSTVYLAYRETVVSRRARRTVDPPLPPG